MAGRTIRLRALSCPSMTSRTLENGRDSRSRRPAGNLFGVPVIQTNNIPNNLGGGAETEVYFIEMAEAVVADTRRLVVDVFPGGAYSTGAGVVSGISQDSTVVRAINEVDFSLMHDVAASVIEMIDWELNA